MTVRKQTDPGGWQSPPGSVAPEDDIPTRPDAADPNTLALVRVFGDLNALDRERAVVLLKNWSRCTMTQRILLESLSGELACVRSNP